jgi:type II secretory pathway pseudopilin PulG
VAARSSRVACLIKRIHDRTRTHYRSEVSEAGDTLVELLIALVVIGITATALLAGFSTSLSASAEHRNLATIDTALKGYVEAATYQIQLQQPANPTFSNFFSSCGSATPGAYSSAITATMSPAVPTGFALPTGYRASITNVQFLTGTTWSPTCTAGVQPPQPQMLTAQVTGNGGSESLDFVVSDPAYLPAPPAAPAITSANSSTQTSTNSFTIPITATGTPEPSLSIPPATLPAGVTFVDNGGGSGTLTGTASVTSPFTVGTYTFTITATNAKGTATQTFTLTINAAPNITSASGVLFTEGVAGSFTVTTTGTPTPTLTESGALPSAVSFVANANGTATISGTPALGTAGNYPISITASNGVGAPFVQAFTFGVTAATKPVFTSAASTGFTPKVTSTFSITTTGAPAATLTETGDTLPPGVTFTATPNSGTATISGTAKNSGKGTYHITISATNVAGTTTQAFTLTVT